MATLNGGITSTAELIRVSGTPPTPGSYFKVGSEAIRFLGTSRGPQGRAFTRDYWSVDRGVAGTTKATHSNGATLTQYYPDAEASGGGGSISATDGVTTVDPATSIQFPAGTMVDLGGGVAGVGLVLSLIGPLPLAWDDPTQSVSGADFVNLAAIPAGSLVLRAWGLVTAIFTLPSDPFSCAVELSLVTPADDTYYDVGTIKTANVSSPSAAVRQSARFDEFPTADSSTAVWSAINKATRLSHVLGGDVFLGATFVEPDGGSANTPTAGAADIYVIIATPAS